MSLINSNYTVFPGVLYIYMVLKPKDDIFHLIYEQYKTVFAACIFNNFYSEKNSE
jgi:hypothetical protein